MSPAAGAGVWVAEVLLVASLSGTRAGAGVAVAVSFLLLPFPASVTGPPIVRFMLAVAAVLCFLRAVDLWQDAPKTRGWVRRGSHLVATFDTRLAERRPPAIEGAAIARFAMAGIIFLAALVLVHAAGRLTGWERYAVRWPAGAVMVFAGFESLVALIVALAAAAGVRPPVLHDRPYLACSVAEFWGRRWNRAVSAILRERCFEPLARRSRTLAVAAVFAGSAALHAYAGGVSLGREAAASWAAFFLVQPLLLGVERRLRTRHWPVAARRAWTAGALGFGAPLFLEPFIRLFE